MRCLVLPQVYEWISVKEGIPMVRLSITSLSCDGSTSIHSSKACSLTNSTPVIPTRTSNRYHKGLPVSTSTSFFPAFSTSAPQAFAEDDKVPHQGDADLLAGLSIDLDRTPPVIAGCPTLLVEIEGH